MTHEETIAQFITTVHRLQGMPCWSVQISGVGSLANLHFGGKIRRDKDKMMTHPDFKVDVDERIYQGEVVLYLEECPWRLDSITEVVCSWMDENEAGGRLHKGLMMLKDRRVTDAEVIQPGFDLIISFEGGLILRVFPDQVDPETGDNYAVNTAHGETFVLAANSTLHTE